MVLAAFQRWTEDHRFCGRDFYVLACHQATGVSTTRYYNNQNKQ